jgi:hypothetical protein
MSISSKNVRFFCQLQCSFYSPEPMRFFIMIYNMESHYGMSADNCISEEYTSC